MAEALASAIAAAIVSKITSELLSTVSPSWGFRSELQKLDKIISLVRLVLRDAEEKQVTSHTVRVWLMKLRAMLLEADNLLDRVAYMELRRRIMSLSGSSDELKFISKVSLIFSLADSYKLFRDMRKIRQSMDNVVERSHLFDFRLSVVDDMVTTTRREQSYSFVPEEEVIGRDDDKKRIIEMLLDFSSIHYCEFGISVVSIVGLGGLGKTTLAQLVFNDEKVTNYFELRAWACVSDKSNDVDILGKIVDSAVGRRSDSGYTMEDLVMLVQREIKGKLFLIVLDDCSIRDPDTCFNLLRVLGCGARGSKLLVTTRTETVRYFRNAYIYKLQGLSDENSWSLFERVAFGPGEASMKPELVRIGKEIVSKCENIPLVIRMVANLLYQKGLDKWLQFRDERSDIMDLFSRNKKDDVLNVLRPSYDELHPLLKDCFAFCSLFPKGYEFSKHDLVYLWMAQDFLSPLPQVSVEDVGEECFQQLLGRCFFEDAQRDTLGDIIRCRMPNMLHHLAQNVAGAASILALSDFTEFDDRTLHVSVGFDGKFPEALFEACKIRTLLWLKHPECGTKLDRSVCHMIISKFKCLRALDLHDSGIDMVPHHVGDLIHLRYLDLSKNDSLVTLPNSVTKLYNLRTLKLNFCQKLERLPKGIGNLVMLRCLEIDECDRLTYMPLGLEKLIDLRTLNRFVVSTPGSSANTSGGLKVLNTLDNLRGRLKIELSGQWTTLVHESPEAKLRSKSGLTDLKIEWRHRGLDDIHKYYYYGALLEGLQPPHNLKVLCIEGYRGKDFPSWAGMDKLASSLPNLVSISIEGCKECKHLPPFGHLNFLKYLTLRHMEGVEYVENGTYDPPNSSTPPLIFPSLEELTLHSFYNLKGWWKEVGVTQQNVVLPSFPLLSKLNIWNCPKLTSIPLFPCAQEVDFQNVNQKLLEVPTISVAATASASAVLPPSPSSSSFSSNAHSSHIPSLSRVQSSKAMPNGWLQNLSYLRRLRIKGFPNMKAFPTVGYGSGGTSSLQFLIIDKCDSLVSLIEGLQHLKSLEEFEIAHCKELNFWDDKHHGFFPWSSLTSLRYLIFREIPKMESLPEGLQQIKTLKFLWIATCNGLTALPEWIDQISSLQHLRIEGCRNLTSLPPKVRCLRNLVKLEIMECPKLIERCREPNGEDWSNISHIPRVLLHKSWRYGLMNDAERIPISAAAQSRSKDGKVYKQ